MRSYGVGLTILKVMWVDCSQSGMVCRVIAALEDVVVAFRFHVKSPEPRGCRKVV
jgi:hypothetical protein